MKLIGSEYDPETNVTSEYYLDHATMKMTTKRIHHDVDPVLEDVSLSKNLNRNGFSQSRNYRKLGSIPMVIIEQYFQKGINLLDGSQESAKICRRILNDMNKLRVPDSPV